MRGSVAVVGNAHRELRRVVGEFDDGVAAPSMFHHVGQGLLHESVRRDFQRAAEISPLAGDLQLDRYAGSSYLADQFLDGGQSALRCEALPVVAEHAEQQVELVDGATATVLNQRQRLTGLRLDDRS